MLYSFLPHTKLFSDYLTIQYMFQLQKIAIIRRDLQDTRVIYNCNKVKDLKLNSNNIQNM
jgi:hypothetical protein